MQLCGQVSETLTSALAASADALLRDSIVISVVPAPSSMRLLVTIATAGDAEQAMLSLQRASAWLRGEVARSITRRKTPELIFRIGV